ncbi:hypothetical protein MASR1M36_08270 [Candidatus Cloacimonadaceae bacterium]
MKKILIMAGLLALVAIAFAQPSVVKADKDNHLKGLGVHFGTLSANGFSYRSFGKQHGYQITLGGITLGDRDEEYVHFGEYNGQQQITLLEDGRRTNLNVGLNYIKTLAQNRTGRFYVFGGGSYLYSRVKQFEVDFELINNNPTWEDEYRRMDTADRVKWDNRHYYYVGAGLGFDFNLGQNFHWAVELPLTMNQDTEFMMYIPQTGLYYYFD